MANRRTVVRLGAQATAGLIASAVIVAVIAAAIALPFPRHTVTPPSTRVVPTAGEGQRVCAGPVLSFANDASAAGSLTPIGEVSVVTARAEPIGHEIRPGPIGFEISALASVADAGRARTSLNLGPQVIANPSRGTGELSLAAASESQSVASGEVAGFAASTCGEPSAESWLVAGSTEVGRTSLVLLSNPTLVTAVVSITVYGESGIVSTPGSNGIAVPAQSQKIIALAGLAPTVVAPVVHVASRGGLVFATLQQSVVRGLEPGGVEMSTSSALPATTQTIPGVVFAKSPEVALGDSGSTRNDSAPIVRLVPTGDRDTVVTITVASEDPAGPKQIFTATTKALSVADVPLSGIGDGIYTVTVSADEPVVSAARTTTIGAAGGRDFAWFASVAPNNFHFAVATTPDVPSRLHLVNPSRTLAVMVTVTPENGAPTAVTLDGGQSFSLDTTATPRVVISNNGPVVASASFVGDGKLSAITIAPPDQRAAPLTVYTG